MTGEVVVKSLRAALTCAFFTGTFTAAGFASATDKGRPGWYGAVVGTALGMFIGLGCAYPTGCRPS
jgi:hypothetical protein